MSYSEDLRDWYSPPFGFGCHRYWIQDAFPDDVVCWITDTERVNRVFRYDWQGEPYDAEALTGFAWRSAAEIARDNAHLIPGWI